MSNCTRGGAKHHLNHFTRALFWPLGSKRPQSVHFLWPRGSNALWEGFKSEHPLCRPLHIFKPAPKANKGFQQQPMCRNPLFSAVFPIFCSIPLYQLSGLHFRVPFEVGKAVLFCVVFKDSLLVAYGIGFPGKLVLVRQSRIKGGNELLGGLS